MSEVKSDSDPGIVAYDFSKQLAVHRDFRPSPRAPLMNVFLKGVLGLNNFVQDF